MEYFDIVDEKGNPTGETVERARAHAEGIRHRTAHIWLLRQKPQGVEVLLQRRSYTKDSFPGQLDTSSAGHIQAGDEPLESALRELEEELGISAAPEKLEFIGNFYPNYVTEFYGRPFKDNEVVFVYAYTGAVDTDKLTLQQEEVAGVEWHDLKEAIEATLHDDEEYCVPVTGLRIVEKYAERKGWL